MQRKQDFIYGRQPILDQLAAGTSFERIILQKGVDREFSDQIYALAKALDIPVQATPKPRLQRITGKNHQGVIAFTAWVEYEDLENVVQRCYENSQVPAVVILDGITDVRNVGAIARSAEVLGATCLVLPAKGAAQINADTVKTSAGAILNLPVCRVKSIEFTVSHLQNMGLQVFAADQGSAGVQLSESDFTGPLAIILGSEKKGVDRRTRSKADQLIRIPQVGKTESLNVSVASGIILYEVSRQRNLMDG